MQWKWQGKSVMLIDIIKPDFVFSDERGSLTQLFHKGFNQINIIFSKKGIIRGNHYHRENKEAFFVICGSFELTVKRDKITEVYNFKKGDMFLVPPFVLHSFHYHEDTWLAGLYDKGVEHIDGTKDIYSEQ